MAPAGSPDHTGDRSQITSGSGARMVRNAVADTPSRRPRRPGILGELPIAHRFVT